VTNFTRDKEINGKSNLGSGIKKETGKKRHPYQANHSLRNWFKTRCEIAGMKPINIEKLMNHSIGISDSYYRATEQELLEDYLKAVDMLSINDDKAVETLHTSRIGDNSNSERIR